MAKALVTLFHFALAACASTSSVGWSYYVSDSSGQDFLMVGHAEPVETWSLLERFHSMEPVVEIAYVYDQSLMTYRDKTLTTLNCLFKSTKDRDRFHLSIKNAFCTQESIIRYPEFIGISTAGNLKAALFLAGSPLAGDLLVLLKKSSSKIRHLTSVPNECGKIFLTAHNKFPNWSFSLQDDSHPEMLLSMAHDIFDLPLSPLNAAIHIVTFEGSMPWLTFKRCEVKEETAFDRFELKIPKEHGVRILQLLSLRLNENIAVLGSPPWLGLEKAYKLRFGLVDEQNVKFEVFFRPNSVSKIDVQRVFSGMPYIFSMDDLSNSEKEKEDLLFRVITFFENSNSGYKKVMVSGPQRLTFDWINPKNLCKRGHYLLIRKMKPEDNAEDVPDHHLIFKDPVLIIEIPLKANISYFITRLWADLILNEPLSKMMSRITQYILFRPLDSDSTIKLYVEINTKMVFADGTPSTDWETTIYILHNFKSLFYTFARYCGVACDTPKVFINFNTGQEEEIDTFENTAILFTKDLVNFDMKWFEVRVANEIANSWINTEMLGYLNRSGSQGSGRRGHKKVGKQRKTENIVKETEISVDAPVLEPLVYKEGKLIRVTGLHSAIVATKAEPEPEPVPTETTGSPSSFSIEPPHANQTSWDEFYNSLD